MSTFQMFAGSAIFALLLIALCAWALIVAARALDLDGRKEGSDAAGDLLADRPFGPVAAHRGRTDDGDVFPVSAEERRRELRRRLEAATKERGPARLASRRVPTDAA